MMLDLLFFETSDSLLVLGVIEQYVMCATRNTSQANASTMMFHIGENYADGIVSNSNSNNFKPRIVK